MHERTVTLYASWKHALALMQSPMSSHGLTLIILSPLEKSTCHTSTRTFNPIVYIYIYATNGYVQYM